MSFLQKEIKLSRPRMPAVRAPRLGAPKLGTPKLSAPRRGGHGRRVSGVVGLELGAVQAIAARGQLRDGRVVADQLAVRPLPDGLVRDGIVLDPEALAAELKEMFSEHGLPRRVRVGLATPRTILRVIDLPPLDESDIKVALPLQAADRIPMPLDSAILDHQTIGLVDTPEGQRLQVIVVATERTGVEPLAEALRGAGLKVEGIDLSMFAVIRALSGVLTGPEPVLYAQLGDLVNLAIAESGVCRFTRQAPQGLAHVLGRLVEQRGGTTQEAHALLLSAAADGPGEATRDDLSTVGAVLGRVAAEIGSELRAAAEFYGNQSGAAVTRGVVTGALAPLRGFVDAVAENSGLDLVCGEVAVADDDVRAGVDPRVAPVALGLTVGRVGA
jgi:type IV pilus assembly protein PilM